MVVEKMSNASQMSAKPIMAFNIKNDELKLNSPHKNLGYRRLKNGMKHNL